MLSKILRPMVRAQIGLLANCQDTRLTLIQTITEWLGFAGLKAEVTQLDANSDKKIHLSLTVEKPEACDSESWQKILGNLNANPRSAEMSQGEIQEINSKQKTQLYRLLAYLIQVGEERGVNWEDIYPQLQSFGLDEEMLQGIRAALKVPQSWDLLIEQMEPDVVAIALPKAVSIALMDRKINPDEDRALNSLFQMMKESVKTGN